MSLRAVVLASIAALALSPSAHASTFGLENSINATPTFSITAGGNTATYSSVAGNQFAVQDTTGLLSFNTALLDNNFNSDALTITFSNAVTGTIIIPFAILNGYSTTELLTVASNTGQTMNYSATPTTLPLGEPEGLAQFALTGPTSSITLNATNPFAIGDISTNASVAATPEPTSLVLLASGLSGVMFRLRRRA